MRNIDILFSEYGESHQNHTNKLIHWFCVPLIFISILGFIALVPTPSFHLNYIGAINIPSFVVIIFLFLYYLRLSWRIALYMMVFIALSEFAITTINIQFSTPSWMIFLSLFIVTWALQFIGHHIEGKKPSFLKDLQFLLVGPIWLLHFILNKFRLKY